MLVVINFLIIIILNLIASSESELERNGCGRIFSEKQFIIESPLYPTNYPINLQCYYLIKGPQCSTEFTIQFLEFHLEESEGCHKDRLEVGDQDAICGSKSGINKKYSTNNGTLVLKLVSDQFITDRGFKLLVTRSDCQQQVPDWATTSKDVEFATPVTQQPEVFNRDYPKCCQNFYDSKTIYLVSPNFPNSITKSGECIYEIRKNNPEVCRLRIHFNFFFLGPQIPCSSAYLEIDGKKICGCKSELKLISPFEASTTKTIKFFSKGLEVNSFTGFILEIFQDECPKRYVPAENNFRYYKDQRNSVSWPLASNLNNLNRNFSIEKIPLVNERNQFVDDVETKSGNKIIKHVYFFDGDNSYNTPYQPRDREETTYLDTQTPDLIIDNNNYNYGYCLEWNRRQFEFLSSQYSNTRQSCNSNEVNNVGYDSNSKCIELGYLHGYFKSPGHPLFYPGNLDICFRFRRIPGFCRVRVLIKDFELEDSVNCYKDFLAIGGDRYCGSRLSGAVLTFDMNVQPLERGGGDIHFVTDTFYCRRGFFAIYEQIACNPLMSTNPPPFHPQPPLSTTTISPLPPPFQPCDKRINSPMFTLDVYDFNGPSCRFLIEKYNEDVCQVKFYFEKFDLVCASESIVIDGTMYCGHMTGRTVTVDVGAQNPIVFYKKISDYQVQGLRLRIRGEQINYDCPYLEVPAERLASINQQDVNSRILFKMNKEFKDVCGIVTNRNQTDLPATFCDLLKTNMNVTMCIPLSENSFIVPLDGQKVELKVKDAEQSEEIEFDEVDCDEI